MDALQTAARLSPNDPAIHYVKGLYFKTKADLQQAIHEFRRSIQLAAKVPEAHYELGLLLRQRGELESAAGEFRKAIELSPADGQSPLNLAQILQRQGKAAESRDVIQKVHDLRRNRETFGVVQVYNDTGIRLVERGDLAAAIGYFRAAVDLRPDYSEIHRNLARALFQAGQLDEAGREYQTAIRLNGRDWQAHYGLGEVLAQQNHMADGRSEEHTSELQSHHELVCRLLLEKKKNKSKPRTESANLVSIKRASASVVYSNDSPTTAP